MCIGKQYASKIRFNRNENGSLTVEAALVMPVFLYLMIAFLYFIQIFTVQEQIQSAITKMGLNLTRTSYIVKDFPSMQELLDSDTNVFGVEMDLGLDELADHTTSAGMLKLYAIKYLDTASINQSCILDGFEGIRFYHSSVFNDEDYIDIVTEYTVRIPVALFPLRDMHMMQRVRLQNWTGFEVAAAYTIDENSNASIVYITENGEVYHKDRNCSHIKLSVTEVAGIPNDRRNDNGGKYYPCAACHSEQAGENANYYITSDGTRYHTRRDCSKITRKVKEIPLSEAGDRRVCKRCGK